MTVRLLRDEVARAVRNNPQFRAHTTALARRAEREAVRVARDAGIVRRSGRYEDGFEAFFTPSGLGVRVLGTLRLVNTVHYASILEGGSRPHVIRVRRKKVLYSAEENRFFGRQVNHPGTHPYQVIRTALLRVVSGRAAL